MPRHIEFSDRAHEMDRVRSKRYYYRKRYGIELPRTKTLAELRETKTDRLKEFLKNAKERLER